MSPMEGETRQRSCWWQCSCWQERQQRLEMPCRGWPPCSRNHVFLYFIFSCCHLTCIPTDLSRCAAGKWRAGNRTYLTIFFFLLFGGNTEAAGGCGLALWPALAVRSDLWDTSGYELKKTTAAGGRRKERRASLPQASRALGSPSLKH